MMNIDYTVHIWKEGTQYIAHAMPLDIMSSGETPEESRKALDEAVRLFLNTASDIGTLQDILIETGYELKNGDWVGPDWVATERHAALVGA